MVNNDTSAREALPHHTLLLLLPSSKQMYPLSTAALTQAQASRDKLRKDYADALLLYSDGSLRRIDNVTVLGPFGDNWARRLLSRLTQGWRISVQLSEPIWWELQRLRASVLDCLAADAETEGGGTAEIARAVREATNTAEVFAALRLPPPDEALDVL